MLSAGLSLALAASTALAKAPRSKEIPHAVDTAAGSITDPNNLLRVSLDGPVTISVDQQPALVVFNRLKSYLGIDFGYEQGLNREQLVTLKIHGSGREALNALGNALKVRYEAVGPMQMRVMRAMVGSVRKPPAEPPPAKHP